MGDAEYMAAFHQVIMPVAYEYNPELVFISCGFDSGKGDPLVCCDLLLLSYLFKFNRVVTKLHQMVTRT